MAKHHDENKDLQSIAKVANVNYADHTIQVSKSAIIGIRRLGKLDFLRNYCGWTVLFGTDIAVAKQSNEDSPKKRTKKDKTHKLTDKRRKARKNA